MTTETLQLVPHDQILEFEARGWTVTDDLRDIHHGAHAVLMKAPETVQRRTTEG